jgi:protein-disulfide isomerase
MMYARFFLLVLCCFFQLACKPASENAAVPPVKKEAWVTDEVLVQLQEIKTDLAEVKKQQAELKALLEKGAVRSGAPAAKAVGSVSLRGTPPSSAKVAVVEFTDYQCPGYSPCSANGDC